MSPTLKVARVQWGLLVARGPRLGIVCTLFLASMLVIATLGPTAPPGLVAALFGGLTLAVGAVLSAEAPNLRGIAWLPWPALPLSLGRRARGVAFAEVIVWLGIGLSAALALRIAALALPGASALAAAAPLYTLLGAPVVAFGGAQRTFLASVRPGSLDALFSVMLANGVCPLILAAASPEVRIPVLACAALFWGAGLFVHPWGLLPAARSSRDAGPLSLGWRDEPTALRVVRILLRRFFWGPTAWLPVRGDAYLAAQWTAGMASTAGFLVLAFVGLGALGWPMALLVRLGAVGLGASSAALSVLVAGIEPGHNRWWVGLATREPFRIGLATLAAGAAMVYSLGVSPSGWVALGALVAGVLPALGTLLRGWGAG